MALRRLWESVVRACGDVTEEPEWQGSDATGWEYRLDGCCARVDIGERGWDFVTKDRSGLALAAGRDYPTPEAARKAAILSLAI